MRRIIKKLSRIPALVAIVALVASNLWGIPQARAATLTGSSVSLSDARTSQATVTYTVDFDNVTTSAIKCIKMVFSDAATGGSAPTGLSTASATYSAASSDYIPDVQTWTADGTTTPGTVVITNATGETPASATDATVVVTGMTNGSTRRDRLFHSVQHLQ